MLLINPAQERFGGMLSRYIPVGIPVALGILAAYMPEQPTQKHGKIARWTQAGYRKEIHCYSIKSIGVPKGKYGRFVKMVAHFF